MLSTNDYTISAEEMEASAIAGIFCPEKREKENPIEKRLNMGPIPSIVNLGNIIPEQVKYLWPPYIPIGKLTILEGDPGIGKTFLALSICAAVSVGGFLPDQDGKPSMSVQSGRILFLTAEDGLADTLVPRLEMMGADRDQISCLTGWRSSEDAEEQAFALENIEALVSALIDVEPDLVVIDPLQAYLGSGVDMHRANETRPLLSNLGRVAEEFECAILAIRHLSKSSSKAIYRGLGSIDFAAAARSILTVGLEPTTKQKAMAHVKSSCAENGATLGFEIHPDFGFRWTGVSLLTAEDLLASGSSRREDEKTRDSRLDESIEFLHQVLDAGPLETKEIKKQADEAGISFRTVQRAKGKLNFKAYKSGAVWFWPQLESSMPDKSNGADGAVDTIPKAVGGKGSAPSVPTERFGTVENCKNVL